MSRPGSSAQTIGSLQSEGRPVPGPSRAPVDDFYGQAPGADASRAAWQMPGAQVIGHPPPHMVYPMGSRPQHPGAPSGMGRLPPGHDSQDEDDFLPEDPAYAYPQTTPYHQQHPSHSSHPHHMGQPHYIQVGHPGYPPPHPHSTSPTAMMGQHGHPMMHIPSPSDAYHMTTPMPQQYYAAVPPRRPGMQQRHSGMAATRPPPIQRHYSLQPPPHPARDDVFALASGSTPIRGATPCGDYQSDSTSFYTSTLPQGISPARALGPAPGRVHDSPLIDSLSTPLAQRTIQKTPSSLVSSAMSESSTNNSKASPIDHLLADSDEDHETPIKPTKAAESKTLQPPALPRRQVNPPAKPKAATGGKTGAKFATAAPDPGVEGVPPGPKTTERPAASFASLIGQAILSSSVGGLSLEHIYRWIEHSHPFFTAEESAWRNSVRHNLSIHKMFKATPRTERHPAGKGGIWVIHEDEKCHWPENDKFVKNFPQGHPHHLTCRQASHEKVKDEQNRLKCEAEGREYVKKGKRAAAAAAAAAAGGSKKSLDQSTGQIKRASSSCSPKVPPLPSFSVIPQPLMKPTVPAPLMMPDPPMQSITPKPVHRILHPPPHPALLSRIDDVVPLPAPSSLKGTVIPPRFGSKRPLEGDEENVFTSAPKRVRMAPPPPLPLAPMQPDFIDDAYVTPERERQQQQLKHMMMSSAFKTPGLVDSQSSPASSPMPPTMSRTGLHHPSALKDAWTGDDLLDSPPDPEAFALDAAFDIVPKGFMPPDSLLVDDDFTASSSFSMSLGNPPKTPHARSRSANDAITPKPAYGSTPGMPELVPCQLSTPAWEILGVLDRLKPEMQDDSEFGGSEIGTLDYPSLPSAAMRLRTPSAKGRLPLGLRSPLTSTDPSKYSNSASSGISPSTMLFSKTDGDTPVGPGCTGSSTKATVNAAAALMGRAIKGERERTRSAGAKLAQSLCI